MTLEHLIHIADKHPFIPLLYLISIPFLTWMLSFFHKPRYVAKNSIKILYAVLIYAACIPGILALVLTLYSLFFIFQNLIKVNLMVYFMPIISMVATLVIIKKRVGDFQSIPGFKRLSGLMILIGGTFIILLIIQKTNIWIFFGGSILWIFIFGIGIFFLLKFGGSLFLNKRKKADHDG